MLDEEQGRGLKRNNGVFIIPLFLLKNFRYSITTETMFYNYVSQMQALFATDLFCALVLFEFCAAK